MTKERGKGKGAREAPSSVIPDKRGRAERDQESMALTRPLTLPSPLGGEGCGGFCEHTANLAEAG